MDKFTYNDMSNMSKIKSYEQDLRDLKYYIQMSNEQYKILDYIIKYANDLHQPILLKRYINDVINGEVDNNLYKTKEQIMLIFHEILNEYNHINECINLKKYRDVNTTINSKINTHSA